MELTHRARGRVAGLAALLLEDRVEALGVSLREAVLHHVQQASERHITQVPTEGDVPQSEEVLHSKGIALEALGHGGTGIDPMSASSEISPRMTLQVNSAQPTMRLRVTSGSSPLAVAMA